MDLYQNSNTLYVGNLDPKVTKQIIYELFIQLSPVSKIRYPKDKITRDYQGYAFVELTKDKDCEYVIKCLNNTVFLFGRPIKVRKANMVTQDAVEPSTTNAKLFVKNLDESVTIEILNKLFSKFGSMSKKPEIFYLKNGELRCGYIFYKRFKHADQAILKLNNQIVANKLISVEYAFKDFQTGVKHGDEVERLLDLESEKNSIF